MPCKLSIDRECGAAPYRQIYEQLRAAVYAGVLSAGEKLPSVREAAAGLSVNPLTVSRAVAELEAEGLVRSEWGKGIFIRPIREAGRDRRRTAELEKLAEDFVARARRLGFREKEIVKMVDSAASNTEAK